MKIGQINLDTKPGQIIYDISARLDINTIFEIGTWNGMGSTMCVIKSLIDNNLYNKKFISIDLYPEMYNEALENLKDYLHLVELLHGRIIGAEDTDWFDHSIIDFNTDTHAKLYYKTDMEFLTTMKDVSDKIPNYIDLLILDGGEYTTYPEWKKLRSRTKIVVLDDVNILKTSRIRKEILESNNYITIYEDLEYRNGFSAFERKSFIVQ